MGASRVVLTGRGLSDGGFDTKLEFGLGGTVQLLVNCGIVAIQRDI